MFATNGDYEIEEKMIVVFLASALMLIVRPPFQSTTTTGTTEDDEAEEDHGYEVQERRSTKNATDAQIAAAKAARTGVGEHVDQGVSRQLQRILHGRRPSLGNSWLKKTRSAAGYPEVEEWELRWACSIASRG